MVRGGMKTRKASDGGLARGFLGDDGGFALEQSRAEQSRTRTRTRRRRRTEKRIEEKRREEPKAEPSRTV